MVDTACPPDPTRPDPVRAVMAGVGLEPDEVVEHLLDAVRAKDEMTFDHVLRTTVGACEFAVDLGLPLDARRLVVLAALLHDVGKVAVPDSVLTTPRRLTDDEWEVMRGHVAHGVRMLQDAGVEGPVIAAVGAHHEHWDGGGYPAGLLGQNIPLAARIVSVCDAVDAMRFARRYRTGNMTVAEVVEVLEVGAGTQWDPDLVSAMVQRLHAA